MTTPDDNFSEYFTLAQAEALTARESHILDLRYGFANGDPHTLEQVRILTVGIIVISYWIVTNRNRGDAT